MPTNLLGELSPQRFLDEYWQKKPLLIRNALPGFRSPIDPDELAGLACDDDVESRIILEKDGVSDWELRHGPFSDQDFTELPETHWTLLVQECNRHVPALAGLLDQFRFIPNWRVDDVMASYAPAHGTVGPHTDQYDVFLLQGLGTRRWQINTDTTQAELLPGLDLRILKHFETESEWVVEPGDLLYLPPGVAHYGVALEDCITLSIGFRAPTHQDILSGFVDHLGEQLNGASEPRYTDPDLTVQQHPGEISPAAIAEITRIIQSATADETRIRHWFGRYITEPKNALPDLRPDQPVDAAALLEQLQNRHSLHRSEYSRFAFLADSHSTRLYIDGEEIALPDTLGFASALLCDKREYTHEDLKAHLQNGDFINLLVALCNTGKLYFETDE